MEKRNKHEEGVLSVIKKNKDVIHEQAHTDILV